MNEWLIKFANWLLHTPWALAIASSDNAYAFAQLTHFTGLSLWLGTSVAVDLRLIGLGGKRGTPSQLCDALLCWNWIGLCLAVAGGFALFSTAAPGFVVNPAFRLKLGIFLPLALSWHVIVQRKISKWSEAPGNSGTARWAGLLELLLWLAVVTSAVSIPYF